MNILGELRTRFRAALGGVVDDPEPYVAMVRPAQDPRFGDFQANCAMPLAKQLGGKPRDVAADLVARLDVRDLCEPPEVAGPGFINIRLRDEWLAEQTGRVAADERLGVARAAAARKYVVDFSAPNVAKPMHVGHLRSTVIGDSLARVLRFLGHSVVTDNHIGDWGTQFGMIIYGYKHFRDEAAYRREPVAELARLYRLVNQLADYHEAVAAIPRFEHDLGQKRATLEAAQAAQTPADKGAERDLKKLRTELAELEGALGGARRKRDVVESDPPLRSLAAAHVDIAEAARRETAKLHAEDPENLGLWQEFIGPCVAALLGLYDRLDVGFDLMLGESHYREMLPDVAADLRQGGIARESEGALCVFVEGTDAPFIVQKSDGAFTYATTDLATIKDRVERLGAEEILYVVDARQSGHFQLLFETARRWGYDRTVFRHVSFGTVLGQDRRPFKTRAGDTIGLESLLDEAATRARRIVDENDDAKKDDSGRPAPELDEAARQRVADIVGIGGIKYADLRHNRESDYVFSWEKMLALTGDTATYMQYAYARICGIFRKGGLDRRQFAGGAGSVRFTGAAERGLALQLVRFAEAVEDVVSDYRPNVLTDYLFATANAFSTFYQECPVLQEPDEAVRTSRLTLCAATARVMERGLELLGIRTSERM
jgi:arginyl-tRNA synthetase